MGWLGEISSGTAAQTGPFTGSNQSGNPRFGPLPRKHSLERVSPYPSALAERSHYYHFTALTHPFVLHVQRRRSSSWLDLDSPPALELLTHSSLTDCHQEPVIWRNVISSAAIGCAPHKSVVTVSYYIVYLPEGGGSRALTTFKSARSGGTASPHVASRG